MISLCKDTFINLNIFAFWNSATTLECTKCTQTHNNPVYRSSPISAAAQKCTSVFRIPPLMLCNAKSGVVAEGIKNWDLCQPTLVRVPYSFFFLPHIRQGWFVRVWCWKVLVQWVRRWWGLVFFVWFARIILRRQLRNLLVVFLLRSRGGWIYCFAVVFRVFRSAKLWSTKKTKSSLSLFLAQELIFDFLLMFFSCGHNIVL